MIQPRLCLQLQGRPPLRGKLRRRPESRSARGAAQRLSCELHESLADGEACSGPRQVIVFLRVYFL